MTGLFPEAVKTGRLPERVDAVAGFCYSLNLNPEDIMQFKIGKPRRRFALLALALSASVLQVLGGSLPSLVVCHKGDRPPRVEFFSDSCSCRQAEFHPCFDPDRKGVPCLGESCTDVHLKSHVLIADRSYWHRASDKSKRRAHGAEPGASGFASFSLRPVPGDRGAPRAASPPPLSLLFSGSRLRC